MTLEEFRLKQKYLTAYGNFCSNRECNNLCPVLQEAKRTHQGCYITFCKLKSANKI